MRTAGKQNVDSPRLLQLNSHCVMRKRFAGLHTQAVSSPQLLVRNALELENGEIARNIQRPNARKCVVATVAAFLSAQVKDAAAISWAGE